METKTKKGCKLSDLKPGTQIIYVPDHADNAFAKEAEPGFVTSVTKNVAFCRYWSKRYPPGIFLRTMANSEATSPRDLVILDTVFQGTVDMLLEGIKGKIMKFKCKYCEEKEKDNFRHIDTRRYESDTRIDNGKLWVAGSTDWEGSNHIKSEIWRCSACGGLLLIQYKLHKVEKLKSGG